MKMSKLNLDEECTFVPNIQKSKTTGRYLSNQKQRPVSSQRDENIKIDLGQVITKNHSVAKNEQKMSRQGTSKPGGLVSRTMQSEQPPQIEQPESAPPDIEDSPSPSKKNVWDRLDDQIK